MSALHRLLTILLLIGIPSVFASESRGKALFALCASCHGPQGQGNREFGAPAIAGLPEWYVTTQLQKFIAGGRGRHPDDDAGNRMRPMARTLKGPNDPQLVAAYVSSLPPTLVRPTVGGNADHGKAYFTVCMACHGPTGDGNRVIGAPPLHMTNDWYLVQQLKNFKAKVRAYDPALDPTGTTMAPMASTLPDEQAMRDVITYVQSLTK